MYLLSIFLYGNIPKLTLSFCYRIKFYILISYNFIIAFQSFEYDKYYILVNRYELYYLAKGLPIKALLRKI